MSLARRSKRGRWLGAAALSALAHAAILPALILGHPPAVAMALELAPTTVTLVREPPPVPTPPPPQATVPAPTPAPAAVQPAPAPIKARRNVAPVAPDPLLAATARSAQSAGADASLTDAQLAGAAVAGSGAAGGECDMARRVQSALRRDPLVQAAVARVGGAGGSAHHVILVWDGDWVRDESEDGKGLAAVREAMMWEIAFAPQACRAESVRGLVLLSLNQTPGAARLVVGEGQWRWSDLLGSRLAR
jgi:hypothetical protein